MNIDGDILIKVAAAAVIFCIAMFGARASQRLKARESGTWLSVGNTFAGGIFIGAGLIHTLADSAGLFTDLYPDLDFPLWAALAAFAVLGLMWIDKAVSQASRASAKSSYTLFVVLSIHSLLAGMALGVEAHPVQALAILVAILAHKGSAAFALGLRTTELGYWRQMVMFACMTPVGVLAGAALTLALQNQAELYFEAVFDAIAAGTFLYVALSEILPGELARTQRPNRLVFSALLGLGLMSVLALYT